MTLAGRPCANMFGLRCTRVANSNSGAAMRNPLNQMRIRRQDAHNTFGMVRTYPNGTPKPHQGWDLFAPVGTPIFAITSGLIRDIRHMPNDAYGMQISLQFVRNGQTLYARYAHLSSVLCAEGQNVTEGQLLGFTGTSGNASGMTGVDEHLHFEIDTQLLPGLGLPGRVDPGEVLGYGAYSSAP
jgi:murein DD-endopeptidase MepM/ murein hydrolase activator NlpD